MPGTFQEADRWFLVAKCSSAKMRLWLKTIRIRTEHTTMLEFWPEIPTKLASNLVEFKNYLVYIVINIYL